jgi:transcription antitermination factor NusG
MNNLGPLGGAIRDLEYAYAGTVASAGTTWYVAETKRYREQVASVQLAQRGITSYLPRIVQWPRPAVGSEVGPMFPGYLFVQAALPDEFYRVTWTPGVKALVTFGDAPPSVDPSIIDFLRSREGSDGVIRCGERLGPKTEVRIVNGPFRGLTAVIEERLAARERVRVLLHILQRETPVELPDKWVRQA